MGQRMKLQLMRPAFVGRCQSLQRSWCVRVRLVNPPVVFAAWEIQAIIEKQNLSAWITGTGGESYWRPDFVLCSSSCERRCWFSPEAEWSLCNCIVIIEFASMSMLGSFARALATQVWRIQNKRPRESFYPSTSSLSHPQSHLIIKRKIYMEQRCR